MPSLVPKLITLTSSLTAALLHALADPTNKRSHTIRLTAHLDRLHADSAAKSTYLKMRGNLARRHIRMIRFEGNTQRYISDLAIVVFTGVKHTADWYLQSFKSYEATSCAYFVFFILVVANRFAQVSWIGQSSKSKVTPNYSGNKSSAPTQTSRPYGNV